MHEQSKFEQDVLWHLSLQMGNASPWILNDVVEAGKVLTVPWKMCAVCKIMILLLHFTDCVQASYYDGNQDDRYTFSSYNDGQFVNDRLAVVELRANRYYSPVNNFIAIRTSTEHPRVSLIVCVRVCVCCRWACVCVYIHVCVVVWCACVLVWFIPNFRKRVIISPFENFVDLI